jgi:hypothetical protein
VVPLGELGLVAVAGPEVGGQSALDRCRHLGVLCVLVAGSNCAVSRMPGRRASPSELVLALAVGRDERRCRFVRLSR